MYACWDGRRLPLALGVCGSKDRHDPPGVPHEHVRPTAALRLGSAFARRVLDIG